MKKAFAMMLVFAMIFLVTACSSRLATKRAASSKTGNGYIAGTQIGMLPAPETENLADMETLLMPWEMLLMEVKIPGAMPLWMSRILSELDIYPTSYSKYGTYYQNYIEESTEKDFKERGVEICA